MKVNIKTFSIGIQTSIKKGLDVLVAKKIIDHYRDLYEDTGDRELKNQFIAFKGDKVITLRRGDLMYDVIITPGQNDDGTFSGPMKGELNSCLCSINYLDTAVINVLKFLK